MKPVEASLYALLLEQIKPCNIVLIRLPVKPCSKIGWVDIFYHHVSIHKEMIFVVKVELYVEKVSELQGEGKIHKLHADAFMGQINYGHKARITMIFIFRAKTVSSLQLRFFPIPPPVVELDSPVASAGAFDPDIPLLFKPGYMQVSAFFAPGTRKGYCIF